MTDLLWLSDEQLDRIKPYFPLSHKFDIKGGSKANQALGSALLHNPC